MTLPFRLYPEERQWWTAQDYQAVLDVMAHTGARKVLEFGPGSSSLALIEAGAERIDACEDDEEWAGIYEERLVNRFPTSVAIRRYVWADPLAIPELEGERYDLALIDGPRTTLNRIAVLAYALPRARWVFMPTEDFGQTVRVMRPRISEVAVAAGVPLRFLETGRGAGGFALLGPTC